MDFILKHKYGMGKLQKLHVQEKNWAPECPDRA